MGGLEAQERAPPLPHPPAPPAPTILTNTQKSSPVYSWMGHIQRSAVSPKHDGVVRLGPLFLGPASLAIGCTNLTTNTQYGICKKLASCWLTTCLLCSYGTSIVSTTEPAPESPPNDSYDLGLRSTSNPFSVSLQFTLNLLGHQPLLVLSLQCSAQRRPASLQSIERSIRFVIISNTP